MVKLGEVAKERRESIKTDKANMPIVGLEHLIPQQVQLTEWSNDADNTFTKLFHKGDVLFGRRRAYLKKASLAPFDGICSGDITVIAPIENKIAPELLPFIIQNDAFFDYAVEKSAGSLSPRVKWEHLKNYEFKLPGLDEQRKLAKILWAAEETKQAYKKLLQKTDDLVKAKFEEMLNSNSYDVIKLDDIALSWHKGQPFKKTEISSDGYNLCIHYGELFTNYGININKVFSHTNSSIKFSSKKGDILFPASDVTPNGLARCSALMLDNVLLGGDIIVMRPEINVNNPIYLSYAINHQKEQLLSRVTGSLVRHMSMQSLKTITISVPKLAIQNEFVNFAQQAEQSKQQLQKSLDSLNATMRALINENLK
jgi:type I restriction enzyme S subunit